MPENSGEMVGRMLSSNGRESLTKLYISEDEWVSISLP